MTLNRWIDEPMTVPSKVIVSQSKDLKKKKIENLFCFNVQATETVLEFGGELLHECRTDWSCTKLKLLRYIGESVQKDEFRITRDLSFKRIQNAEDEEQIANSVYNIFQLFLFFFFF